MKDAVFAFLRRQASIFSSCYAPCVTCGAAGALVTLFANVDPQVGFLVGFGLAVWPVYAYSTREARIHSLMQTAEKWKKEGLITHAEYKQFCKETIDYFRWVKLGMPPPSQPTSSG